MSRSDLFEFKYEIRLSMIRHGEIECKLLDSDQINQVEFKI